MAKKQVNTNQIVVGNPDGLRLSLSWDKEQPKGTASQATWGRCNLWIGDRLVWGHEDPETGILEGVHWDGIELLEFLVSSWHYLVYEEAYPVNLNPSHPGKLRTLASRRWETMSKPLFLKEETEVYCFEGCHDLADGLNGIFLSTVFLLREGNKMWVGTEEKYYLLCSFAETRQTLE